MKQTTAIAIDLGGSSTKIALVSNQMEIIMQDTISSELYLPYENFIKTICQFIHKGTEFTILGIGIGAPNANFYSGCIENSANLPWKGIIPLAKDLQKFSGLPIVMTNDANVAALGEKYYGSAKEYCDFIFLTLGTGLGSGIFANNQLIYGKNGIAGELGHILWHRNGRLCGCGKKGCAEKYISASAVQINYQELTNQLLPVKDIANQALHGEKNAQQAFQMMAEELGLFLANIQLITDTEAVVMSGGIFANAELFLPRVIQMYKSQKANFQKNMTIQTSILAQQQAALFGAASLIFER